MSDWPLLVLGGVLGSGHCVGMCGAFVVSVGVGARNARENFVRQIAYAIGRVFTYAFLGAVVGFWGWSLQERFGTLVDWQAWFCVIAGVMLITQGMGNAGLLPRTVWSGARMEAAGCLMKSFLSPFWGQRRPGAAVIAGMLNGLLPCGLVYAYLALAATRGSIGLGMLTMAAFGLGTLPLMILTGVGAGAISLSSRTKLVQLAAWCVIATGALTLLRGARFLTWERVCALCS